MFCEDFDKLVAEALTERGLDPGDAHVHCGFDGGQGILKIAVTTTKKNPDKEEQNRAKYSEVSLHYIQKKSHEIYLNNYQGVAARSSKLSSVKRMLVMGAVPDIPENYPNVKMILDELNMEAVDYTMSIDIKMRKYEYFFDNIFFINMFPILFRNDLCWKELREA